YGTTTQFGSNAYGTAYELAYNSMTQTYSFMNLVNFTGSSGTYPGSTPYGGLTMDGQGNLYGTTTFSNGSSSGNGTVFEYNPGSTTFTNLVNFTGTGGSFLGANPQSGVTLNNGNL